MGEQAKQVKAKYLVIDASSYYNMIIWWPKFKQLSPASSILYLCMKYPLFNKWVKVIQGDQESADKCYMYSLKLKKSLNSMHEYQEGCFGN